jgi:hypothetical protein
MCLLSRSAPLSPVLVRINHKCPFIKWLLKASFLKERGETKKIKKKGNKGI